MAVVKRNLQPKARLAGLRVDYTIKAVETSTSELQLLLFDASSFVAGFPKTASKNESEAGPNRPGHKTDL